MRVRRHRGEVVLRLRGAGPNRVGGPEGRRSRDPRTPRGCSRCSLFEPRTRKRSASGELAKRPSSTVRSPADARAKRTVSSSSGRTSNSPARAAASFGPPASGVNTSSCIPARSANAGIDGVDEPVDGVRSHPGRRGHRISSRVKPLPGVSVARPTAARTPWDAGFDCAGLRDGRAEHHLPTPPRKRRGAPRG